MGDRLRGEITDGLTEEESGDADGDDDQDVLVRVLVGCVFVGVFEEDLLLVG